MVPKSNTCLGDYFTSSREKGKAGLPVLSVTLNNGIVHRSDLERRTDTNIIPEDHLLVRKGDIAYNMMRVWQGALGRANVDGIVSPAYIVLRAKNGVDCEYAEYLFKTAKMIYLFWAYSYGITNDRLRLYFNDFKKIPASLPSIDEQRKIARILATWDKAIETTKLLLKSSQHQKKALMQQLLTGQKRLPGYTLAWKTRRLSEVAEIIISPVNKKTEPDELPVKLCNYTDVYYSNRITKKIDFMQASATKSEIKKYTLKTGDVLITKDSETPGDIAIPALIAEDLGGVVCGYHLAIIRADNKNACGDFINHLFSMQKTRYYFFTLATGATRFGLSIGGINKANFLLPPIDEQQKISQVLSTADREIEILQQKLNDLSQEKKALMQLLLSSKRGVKLDEPEVA